MSAVRLLCSLLVAIIVTAAIATLIQTQFNLHRIVSMDVPISAGDRLRASLHDLVHFAPRWIAMTTPALLIAFAVAHALSRRLRLPTAILHALAGFSAVALTLIGMRMLLPVLLVPASSSPAGLILLALAGALGGWTFSHMYRP